MNGCSGRRALAVKALPECRRGAAAANGREHGGGFSALCSVLFFFSVLVQHDTSPSFSSSLSWEMKTIYLMMDRPFLWSLTFSVNFC